MLDFKTERNPCVLTSLRGHTTFRSLGVLTELLEDCVVLVERFDIMESLLLFLGRYLLINYSDC